MRDCVTPHFAWPCGKIHFVLKTNNLVPLWKHICISITFIKKDAKQTLRHSNLPVMLLLSIMNRYLKQS
jgi:hypothetical protein